MILEFIDGLLLRLFIALGSRWFANVAFSENTKTSRVGHIIFAQDPEWLDQTIQLIEKASVKEKI
jgi:hypothetical protein